MCNAGSDCNPSMSTFDGVDVMGERLAEEVGRSLPIFNSQVSLAVCFLLLRFLLLDAYK